MLTIPNLAISQRIHRIGQRRSTTCDILFIEGSQEQEVLERRHGSKAQNAEDDDVIRGSIVVSAVSVGLPDPRYIDEVFLTCHLRSHQHPRFLQNIASLRSPFVVKLLDPMSTLEISSVSLSKHVLSDSEKVDLGVSSSMDQAIKQDSGRTGTMDKRQSTKRARFLDASPDKPDTPSSQHDTGSKEKTTPSPLATHLLDDDRQVWQDSDRPRKKAKATYASLDDA